MIEVFMPKAGMDMKEGTLLRWLKNVGDHVELNEPIMEIETDKINMEAESPGTGILLAKLIENGATVPVLQTIGYIGEPDETIPQKTQDLQEITGGHDAVQTADSTVDGATAGNSVDDNTACNTVDGSGARNAVDCAAPGNTAAAGAPPAATPYAKKLAKDGGIALESILPSGTLREIKGRDVLAALEKHPGTATPLARKYAEVDGVNLDHISGSGFGGKIRKEDVLAAEATTGSFATTNSSDTAYSNVSADVPEIQRNLRSVENRRPVQGMRKVVGERMFSSYSQIPTVMQSMRVDLTELLELRVKINKNREKRISVNDFVLKATAIAVKELAPCRTVIIGNEFVTYKEANIGFAVSVENGLFVPVIHNADQLSLLQISERAAVLAEHARAGTILPDEYSGGTFSVSNMGMYDVYEFTPIINQPECGLLGIGGIHDELLLKAGELISRKIALLCMSYDHRIMDGVGAAKMKLRVRELLQNPVELLM
ncbi:2-oxo acid dehydrogenase subunit E2 [Anoxybacterium hadale]|uniref:2-oxo acid dehydrogenase subunit E2 n=1 Tax=Anoxybacterium hadale TaxID=3408580 RepID=A0ACD1A8V5_9FIRM|nr:2-oxo acid dehydrogenase subunit E2 [Clostridiales bacterium]